MASDQQIAVKKRLIYAEDLFEPVDFTVYMGGRSGGKTMAMYEEIFRKRVEMAPTIDAVEVVRCKNCKHYKPQNQGAHRNCTTPYCMRVCATKVSPDEFCSYGERIADND